MEQFEIFHDKLDALRDEHKKMSDEIHHKINSVAAELAGTVQTELESMYSIKPNDKVTFNGKQYIYKRVEFFRHGEWVHLQLILARVKKDGTESQAAHFAYGLNDSKLAKLNIQKVCGQQ